MLEGFKPITLVTGTPYISITKNGLSFNKTCVVKMNYPHDVVLMINHDRKQIAIQSCDVDDDNATPFFRKKSQKNASVRWNNSDLLRTISDFLGWDFERYSYRINGILYPDQNAMVFDLNKAVISEATKK